MMDSELKLLVSEFLVSILLLPICVGLTRLQVDYRPVKRRNDDKQTSPQRIGQSIQSSLILDPLRMMKRVKDHLGWIALWSGIIPYAISFFTKRLTMKYLDRTADQLLSFASENRPEKITEVEDLPAALNSLFDLSKAFGLQSLSLVFPLLLLPLEVITVRAFAYSPKTRLFKPWDGFTQVLTSDERKGPWRIYLQPGLFFAKFLMEVFAPIIFTSPYIPCPSVYLRGLAGKSDGGPGLFSIDMIAPTLAFLALFAVHEVLDTVFVRLSIQALSQPKPQPYPGDTSSLSLEPAEQVAVDSLVQVHPCEKPVVSFGLPYKGVFQCISKMYAEEGLSSFFRGASYGLLMDVILLPLALGG